MITVRWVSQDDRHGVAVVGEMADAVAIYRALREYYAKKKTKFSFIDTLSNKNLDTLFIDENEKMEG